MTPSAPVLPTVAPPKTPIITAPATPSLPTPVPGPSPGQQRTATTATGSQSIFDRWGNLLPGIPVTWSGPNGPKQIVSGPDGSLSLGPLVEGVHEITVNTRGIGVGGGGNPGSPQQVLVALLLPAVQKAREADRVLTQLLPAGSDLHLKLGVGQGRKVISIDWGNGIRVAVGDVNGDGVPELKVFEDLAKRTSNEVRLAFAGSGPGGGAPQALPEGRRQYEPIHVTKRAFEGSGFPNVSTTWSGPAGRGSALSDGNGVVSLGRLPAGKYDVTFELPGNSGQPSPQRIVGILVGLLLPAMRAVHGVELPLAPGAKGHVTLDVGADGQARTVGWTYTNRGVTHEDTWDGQRLVGAVPGDDGATRLVFLASTAGPGPAGSPDDVKGTLVAWTDGHSKLPSVGVNASGPGGVMQLQTDGLGLARFGKLPVGNTLIDFNGGDIGTAIRTAVGPNDPTPQKTLIELLVVIYIISLKTDGEPEVFAGTWPANTIPPSLRANLRVGSGDGNLMTVDWGKGPQNPQSLTKVGTGTLSLPNGGAYTGNTTVNPGVLKTLQDVARTAKAGDTGALLFAYDPRYAGGAR